MAIARKASQAEGLVRRELGPDDADAVYELHHAAVAAVGRSDLIRPETRRFFVDALSRDGRIFGVFDVQGLLAYGVLQVHLPPEEDLRALFGLAPEAPFAKLAGASVRPGAWGSGLHEELIARRVEAARAMDIPHLYATSAPGNARSWENLLSQDFAIRGLREQYGGLLRFLHYRDLAAARFSGGGVWCDAENVAAQRACLASGRAGTVWRKAAEGRREILYREPT